MIVRALAGELSCMQTGLVAKENNFRDLLFASVDAVILVFALAVLVKVFYMISRALSDELS